MDQVFGVINRPSALSNFDSAQEGGIGQLIDIFIKVLIAAGGVYALFNLILAGYGFMSAGDDAKKVAGAWAKIWQTALGLAVIAGAFVLGAIFSWLIYGKPNIIFTPIIPTI